ncbi:MAG: CsgG/HfaB family protein [Syntrophaceae bacterium]
MKHKRFFLIVFLLTVSFSAAAMALAMDNSTIPSRPQEKRTLFPFIMPRTHRSTLAVLKFINTSEQEQGSRYQPWEYGIAAMLTTDLEETSLFNIVDRERLNDILREHQLQQAGLTDPSTALAIGKLATARYILTGSFMVVGQKLRINVQVFSVEKGILLGAASATGRVDQFFLVEKEIFTKVTPVLKVMLDEDKQAKIINAVETRSVDASLKNYSGEMVLMKADAMKKSGSLDEIVRLMKEAKKMFEEALQYDPDYERAKTNIANMVNAIPMTL